MREDFELITTFEPSKGGGGVYYELRCTPLWLAPPPPGGYEKHTRSGCGVGGEGFLLLRADLTTILFVGPPESVMFQPPR